jgi:hypothetical protein
MNENSQKICEVLSLVTPRRVKNKRKIRVGGKNDGGYVMLDSFPKGVIAYSVGVGGDVSWDIDMAERGIEIFQFDHTVDGPPTNHPKFHFNRIGVGPSDSVSSQFRKLDTLIRDNNHESSELILKMDIEYDEWRVLGSIDSSTIAKFNQIVIEFHGLSKLDLPFWQAEISRSFKKLRTTHFPFHVHGNNWGSFTTINDTVVPNVLEVSYANHSAYKFEKNHEVFPTALDFPCKPNVEDFYLGTFQFPYKSNNRSIQT